ncbi:branched-chain amino acid ABC transporter substrate-binding protein [Streptosporangium violaceochromogenes]|nr:branched-chain amino acid ABC transporter substrate-binding protein [Streptosporangium violaceochromogenes]
MKRSFTGVAMITALVLVATACSGDDEADDPIRVGSINGITGLFRTPEVPQAVRAVFDEVNRAGGINGRRLELVSEDDAMDPRRASEAALKLLETQDVVALVGSSSAVECGVNHVTYSETGVVSIPAVGVDLACFTSPNIAPVNPGPFRLLTAMLYYASETLRHDKVCLYYTVLPDSGGGVDTAVKEWGDLTGKRLTVKHTSAREGDPTPHLLAAKAAGCQAILHNATAGPWLSQAQAQGMIDIDFVMGAHTYTEANAEVVPEGVKVYAGTEWQPYTDHTLPGNDRWAKVVDGKTIKRTAFSQGAVMAADLFVRVLKGIKGEITRESVTQAFKTMEPIHYPMAANPWVFGPDEEHSPIRGSRFVTVENHRWKVAPQGFVVPGGR